MPEPITSRQSTVVDNQTAIIFLPRKCQAQDESRYRCHKGQARQDPYRVPTYRNSTYCEPVTAVLFLMRCSPRLQFAPHFDTAGQGWQICPHYHRQWPRLESQVTAHPLPPWLPVEGPQAQCSGADYIRGRA